jgi:hypothetical protein
MFEAAKERCYPEVFETEAEARQYIAGTAVVSARPWIRCTDVKPMIDSFIVVSGRDVPAKESHG